MIAATNQIELCEEKFNDLLLIGLNEFSVELLPKLVQTIELPAIEIVSVPLNPTFLHVAPQHLSVGASMDAGEFLDTVAQEFARTLGALEYAVKRDVEDAGGFSALVVDQAATSSRGDLAIHSDAVIDAKFTRANQLLNELQSVITGVNRPVPERSISGTIVEQAIAIGFNESFATVVANSVLPPSQQGCSGESEILSTLKGQVCYWSRIWNAKIVFEESTIDASIDVDFGGKIIACVKKFWDCSWTWSCTDMGLSFLGRPRLDVRLLSDGGGVRFACSIDLGDLRPVADLPWPFDQVVEAFFRVIIRFIEAILNLVGAAISFVIIPVKFNLPGQATEVSLSKVTGFPYIAPGASGDKARFIGHVASVSGR